jgi:hypothetical protein
MSSVAFYKVPVGSTLILGDAHAHVLAKDGGHVTVEMHESGELAQYSMDWIQENLRKQTFRLKTPADELKKAELEDYTGGVLLVSQIKNEQERLNIKGRLCLVHALEELEQDVCHKLTHNFLNADGVRTRVIERAKEIAGDRHIFNKAQVGSTHEPWTVPRGRTLAGWLKTYRHFDRNEVVLMSRNHLKGRKGKRRSRLSTRQIQFIGYVLKIWLRVRKPKLAPLYRLAMPKFKLTDRDRAEGFTFPSLMTVYNFRNALSEFVKTVGREGVRHATNLIGAGKTELQYIEYGEAAETDQLLISLFISDDGVIRARALSAEEAEQEPAPNEIRRIWLHYMLDLATRMPLAWVLAESADSDTTMQLLRMATRSKERERVRYGCNAEPAPPVQIKQLISDNGSAVRNEKVVGALLGMGVTYKTTRTYHANDKPFVESAFGAFEGQVVNFEDGYTGGRPGALPGSDPRGEARLKLDGVYRLATQFFIDEFPQQQHRGTGMFAATPKQKLREVCKKYGGLESVDTDLRILHLGHKKEMTVNSEGVQPFGLPFNSPELQTFAGGKNKKVMVHLDPDCLHTVLITAPGHTGDPIVANLSMTSMMDVTLQEYLDIKQEAVEADPDLKAVEDQILWEARKRRADASGMFPDSTNPLNYGRDADLEKQAERLASVETRPPSARVGTVPPGSITDRSHPAARRKPSPEDPPPPEQGKSSSPKKFGKITRSKL